MTEINFEEREKLFASIVGAIPVPISMGYSVDHMSIVSSDSSYPYTGFKVLPKDLVFVPDGGDPPDRSAWYAKRDAEVGQLYYNATEADHIAFVAMWNAYRDMAASYEGYKDALDIVLEEQYTEAELWLVMPQDVRNSYTEKAIGFFGEKSGWSSYGDD